MRTLLFFAFCVSAFSQTAASVSPYINYQFMETSTGVALPCVGCKLYSYTAGTLTPFATFTDYTGTVANSNPITLDSSGYTPSGIWIKTQCYKFILKTSALVTIWTRDQVCDNAQLLKAAYAATSATPGSNGAALIGFEYPGGVARTVQSKLQDVVSVIDFGAVCDGSTDDSTAFVLASTILTSGGTITIPASKTCNIGAGITLLTKQTLDGNGSTLVHSGSGYAITPLVPATTYATNVVVQNLSIRTSSTGGCFNWTASYSSVFNVICTMNSGSGATGLLLPGDSNGTGPYYNDFHQLFVQSQGVNAASQYGVLMTCASTRCPNTNHFYGGRFGQTGIAALVAGGGHSFSGVTFELDPNDVGIEASANSNGLQILGGYFEGSVSGDVGIKIDAGASDTVCVQPYMTSIATFTTNAGTHSTLINCKGQLGPSIFPNIIDSGLTGSTIQSTCSSTAGLLSTCAPFTIQYAGDVVWNSGAGATSPFYLSAAGSGPANATRTAKYIPPPIAGAFTITYVHAYIANTPGVTVTLTLYDNATPGFTCVLGSLSAQECSGTPNYVVAAGHFLSWEASWTGATGLTTSMLAISMAGQ